MTILSRRDVQRLVGDTGLSLVSLDKPRSSHYHLLVTRADGTTAMFVLPSSPSDKRGLLNILSRLKGFAKGTYNPITERNPK